MRFLKIYLEKNDICNNKNIKYSYNGYYIDLFVRPSNAIAI